VPEPIDVLYTARATASKDGRNGHVATDDGVLALDLAVPSAMGGGTSSTATNPEQLFAAGYAACFHSALKLVAGSAGADTTGSTVTAAVGIGKQGKGFGLRVDLDVSLPNVERAQAEALVASAHGVCPYSNATRGNVEVVLGVL
jgi:osmotically inducible protein OsmC